MRRSTLRVLDEEVRQDLAALVVGVYAGKDAQWSASLGTVEKIQ